MKVMNPYFWKRTRILFKSKRKTLLFFTMPLLYSLVYVFSDFNLDYAAFWTAVSCSLISPLFLIDINDMLNYEYRLVVERNRIKLIMGYFVYPTILIYLVSSAEALMALFLFKKVSHAFHISPFIYLMGLIFCILSVAVGDGQIYNYRKWVQYSAAPITILIFALPILSLFKNDFVTENLVLILGMSIILNLILFIPYVLFFDMEKSIIDVMTLVKGYGDMND